MSFSITWWHVCCKGLAKVINNVVKQANINGVLNISLQWLNQCLKKCILILTINLLYSTICETSAIRTKTTHIFERYPIQTSLSRLGIVRPPVLPVVPYIQVWRWPISEYSLQCHLHIFLTFYIISDYW